MKNKAFLLKNIPVLLILLFIASGLGTGCKRKQFEISQEVASSDEALFKLGEGHLKRDPEKARLYMRQVIDSFPKSFYAQRAKLAIANSYFDKGDEGNLILAAAEYREFISLYPYSPSAAFAQFRIGMTYFKKALKSGRDQTKTRQALAELKKVASSYPLSEEAKEAQEKMLECEERLAEHSLGIAVHYYKISAFKASTSRLVEIMTNFPNFSQMDAVYWYLGDSYFKWNMKDQGVPFFTKLISDYPESKFAKKAQERLKEIDKK